MSTKPGELQIVALDETGVQGAGILRVKECFLQFRLCSEQQSPIDSDHPILPALLDDLTVNAHTGEEPLHCPLIHLETVGCEQETAFTTPSLQGVENHSPDVSEVAAANHCRDPKSGPHFQGRKNPDHPLLCSSKCPDLVGLKFMDNKTSKHLAVEPLCKGGCQFKPAGDCSPGHPLDARHGGDPDSMHTHVDDFIEQRPGFMQPIIRSAVGGREGPTAFFATVPPPSALRGDVKGMADDVAFS